MASADISSLPADPIPATEVALSNTFALEFDRQFLVKDPDSQTIWLADRP